MMFFFFDPQCISHSLYVYVCVCTDETVSENLLGLIAAMMSPTHLVIFVVYTSDFRGYV